ncbi:MAG: sglT 1 [Firmicutes bacterium]|nr:sglT 1 [Bacillota bacterium]
MSIQLAIVSIYIAVLFGISFLVKKRADKGSAEYLFAGRKLGTSLIAVNITGLAVGAAATVGVAENAFSVGMAAGWYNGAWAIGALVMGVVAAGKYRALNCSTIPELFERYYDTRGRIVSVIGLIVIQIVITSLQYLAGGAILASLMPEIFSMQGGMIVSAIVFIGITLIGGLWSSGLSNMISVILIYIGIVYSTVSAVSNQGGLGSVVSQLPTTGLDWMSPFAGLGMATVIGWIVVMVTQAITAQGPVQIACGAKNAATARNGFVWGAVLIFPIGFLCALLGLVAKVAFPEISATMALPKVVMSLDPFTSGITLAALWAADVSTACTILLGAGTLFSQDIYKRFINTKVSDDRFVSVNRITIFVLGIGTLWLAFNAVGILKTMLAGLSLTTAFTVVFLFTVFAPSLCRKSSAFYTTIIGMAGLLVWQFVPVLHVLQHPIYFEWIICVATFLMVAVLDKAPIKTPEMIQEKETTMRGRNEVFES